MRLDTHQHAIKHTTYTFSKACATRLLNAEDNNKEE
jgi:hypothetical protein